MWERRLSSCSVQYGLWGRRKAQPLGHSHSIQAKGGRVRPLVQMEKSGQSHFHTIIPTSTLLCFSLWKNPGSRCMKNLSEPWCQRLSRLYSSQDLPSPGSTSLIFQENCQEGKTRHYLLDSASPGSYFTSFLPLTPTMKLLPSLIIKHLPVPPRIPYLFALRSLRKEKNNHPALHPSLTCHLASL